MYSTLGKVAVKIMDKKVTPLVNFLKNLSDRTSPSGAVSLIKDSKWKPEKFDTAFCFWTSQLSPIAKCAIFAWYFQCVDLFIDILMAVIGLNHLSRYHGPNSIFYLQEPLRGAVPCTSEDSQWAQGCRNIRRLCDTGMNEWTYPIIYASIPSRCAGTVDFGQFCFQCNEWVGQ